MAALIQFVDSISASPTVRLDINDGVTWFCTNFKAPPPRLRRSESANAMRDGGVVGSSSYENRTLEIELTLIKEASEDLAATEMQKLWRELDRPSNILRYQPEGMTKPVFFRAFRSDVGDLEELWTAPKARTISLEVLAEPFALGLREELGPYAFNNDPAAGSGPYSFVVPQANALGDVPAPFLMVTTSATTKGMWVATGAPVAYQAESCSLLTDTTNPGGGPDVAMSGAGTNNFVRTSFATAAMTSRLQTPTQFGLFRIAAVVRRSDATSVINVRASVASYPVTGDTVTVPLTTNRQVVDLGVIQVGNSSVTLNTSLAVSGASSAVNIQAQRVSGAGTLDWDAIVFIPASTQTLLSLFDTARLGNFDSTTEMVVGSNGDLLAGFSAAEIGKTSGGFPVITPAQSNTFTLLYQCAPGESHLKATSLSVKVHYHPRYLFVRPVST